MDFTLDSDLFNVIMIAPTIANNSIKDVIINNINRLVYNILPSDVICVMWDNIDSQLSIFIFAKLLDDIYSDNIILLLLLYAMLTSFVT